jgi:iron complex outermembrane receptor protein
MKLIKSYFLIHIPVFVTLCLPAIAEPVITEDDLFADIDAVSGVIHMRQTLQQVPAAVTIIDRQTIEASAAVDVVDLFRLVPGFQVYFNHANKPGVTYHAFGAEFPRRLEVKVDGRSVYESIFSSVEWNTLGVTLDDIDYIEVVRGSNAPADGSNAFLASINIVTRSSLMDDGLSVMAQLGNQGIRNSSVAFSGKIGQLDQRITLQSRRNNGFADFTGVFDGKDREIAIDDGAKTKTLRYKALWTPNAWDSLDIQLGMGDTDTFITHHDYDQRQFDYSYQHLQWKHINNDWSDIGFVLYHNSLNFKDQADEIKFQDAYGMIYAKDLELLGDGVGTGTNVRESFIQSLIGLDEATKTPLVGALGMPSSVYFDTALTGLMGQLTPNAISTMELQLLGALPNNTVRASEYQHFSDRWDAELRGNFYKWDNLRVGLGMATRYDSSKSELFFGSPDRVTQTSYRTYANIEWMPHEKITLNSGFITEKVEQGDSNNSYRVATNYQLAEQQTIRLALNHSYRAPSLLERFHSTDYKYNENIILDVSVKPDPNIFAERLSSYEIGYGGSFLERSLLVDVRIFKEDFSDIIGETRRDAADFGVPYDYDQQVNFFSNVDSLKLRGIEWQLQYRPTDNVLLHANHSYIDAEGSSPYQITPTQITVSLDDISPANVFTGMATYTNCNGLRLSLMYHYKSSYYSDIGKVIEGAMLDSYSRVDFKAARRWPLKNNWMELSFTAQNLGSDYQEHHYFNQFKSKYIFELKFGSS